MNMKNWIIMVVGGGCTFVLPFLMVYLRGRLIGKILHPLVDIEGAIKKYGKPYLKSLMVMSWLFGLAITCFLLFGQWWLMVMALVAASLSAGIFIQTARAAKPKNYFLHVAEQLHHAGEMDTAGVEKFRAAAAEVERRKKEAASAPPIPPEPAAPDENQSPEDQAREFVQQIPIHAESHCKTAREVFGVELDYGADSIAKLDQIISEGWPKEPPATLNDTVVGFGSYLGETIRRLHGGDWCFNEENGLHLDVGNLGLKIFPFAKTEKRFLNGEEDSLEFYYAFIRFKIEEARRGENV
jgi:hypothetical protein